MRQKDRRLLSLSVVSIQAKRSGLIVIAALWLCACHSSTQQDNGVAEENPLNVIESNNVTQSPEGSSAPSSLPTAVMEIEATAAVATGSGTTMQNFTPQQDRPGLLIRGLAGKDATQIVSPWLVTSHWFRRNSFPERVGQANVQLTRYQEAFPLTAHLAFYTPALDQCRIVGQAASSPVETENLPPARLSGGPSVIINSDGGNWQRLIGHIGTDRQGIRYSTESGLPGVMPASATLSIPGDQFPTVAAYPLQEPPPVIRLEPAENAPLTPGSTVRWLANGDAFRIRLDWLAFDGDDRFAGYVASCDARDDGEFQVEDDITQTRLIDVSREYTLKLRLSRILARVDVSDGIIHYQESELAE